jgi:hypothetical protein
MQKPNTLNGWTKEEESLCSMLGTPFSYAQKRGHKDEIPANAATELLFRLK